MSELEQILREASREPQTEPAPPEGFAALESQLATRESKPQAGWFYLLGVVLLLGVAYLTWSTTAATEQPTPVAIDSPRVVPKTKVGKQSTPRTTANPAAAVALPPVVTNLPPLTAEPLVLKTAPPVFSTARQPVFSPVFKESSTPEKKAITVPQKLLRRAAATVVSSPLRTSAPLALLTPTLLPKPPVTAPSWAPRRFIVELSTYPFVTDADKLIFEFAPGTPQNNNFQAIIDGNTQSLDYVDDRFVAGKNFNPVTRLNVLREFNSGFRLGVGVAYFVEWQRDQRAAQDITAATGRFTSYWDYTETYLLGDLTLGYRFRRRHRLSGVVDLSILRTITGSQRNSLYVISPNNARHFQRQDFRRFNFLKEESPIIPVLSAGLDWRLGQRWGVGARASLLPRGEIEGIATGVGVLGSYRF